jgi:hypothetical protein
MMENLSEHGTLVTVGVLLCAMLVVLIVWLRGD